MGDLLQLQKTQDKLDRVLKILDNISELKIEKLHLEHRIIELFTEYKDTVLEFSKIDPIFTEKFVKILEMKLSYQGKVQFKGRKLMLEPCQTNLILFEEEKDLLKQLKN